MGAPYRLFVASLCITATLVMASANNAKSQSNVLKGRVTSSVRPATQPQAVQLASPAMSAEMRRGDSISSRTVSQGSTASSGKQQVQPSMPSGIQQQQQQPALVLPQQVTPPDIPGIPISFYGDTMGRLTKDIRGVYLDLAPRNLLVTMRENGDPTQAPSAFTYSSPLFCAWTGMAEDVGRCDVTAQLLAADATDQFNRLATMSARCELKAAARACDPQFSSGLIIMGTGQVTVVMAADTTVTPNTVNIRSFNGDILVNGIYPIGRPDTLLSGLIGFRRGNMRFDVRTGSNPIAANSNYEGRVTFSLFKGPF